MAQHIVNDAIRKRSFSVMPKIKHQHKYERVEVGKKGWVIYRCTLPDCNHYLPTAELIINRESLCWGLCEGTCIYSRDDYNNKLKRPMCEGCRALRQQQKLAMSNVKELD